MYISIYIYYTYIYEYVCIDSLRNLQWDLNKRYKNVYVTRIATR